MQASPEKDERKHEFPKAAALPWHNAAFFFCLRGQIKANTQTLWGAGSLRAATKVMAPVRLPGSPTAAKSRKEKKKGNIPFRGLSIARGVFCVPMVADMAQTKGIGKGMFWFSVLCPIESRKGTRRSPTSARACFKSMQKSAP
jgi:hypothetical protein